MLITSTIFAESAIVETLFLFKYFKIRFLHINCYHRQWCLSSFKNLNRDVSVIKFNVTYDLLSLFKAGECGT